MANEQIVTAFSFDASGVKPAQANEIIPSGWYACEIVKAQVKPTGKGAAKKGKGLYFDFKIIGGDYSGRMVFGGCMNVENANAQCQEIGQRELSAICHATGIINISDLAVFVGRQLSVKVKLSKASKEDLEKGYEDKNEPAGYKALDGAVAGGSAPAGFVPAVPVAPPSVPVPPAPPAVPPSPPQGFPPVGWQANPNAPGWFWNATTGEQLTEADLQAKFAPASPVPAAPPMPPSPTVAPVAPAPVAPVPPAVPAAPAAFTPPEGWQANPAAPGWYWNAATGEQKQQAELMVPVAPQLTPGAPPPWKMPGA